MSEVWKVWQTPGRRKPRWGEPYIHHAVLFTMLRRAQLEYQSNIVYEVKRVCTLVLLLQNYRPWNKAISQNTITMFLMWNECLLVDEWTKLKKMMIFFSVNCYDFLKVWLILGQMGWFWCMYPVKLHQNLLLNMMARRTKCNHVLEI